MCSKAAWFPITDQLKKSTDATVSDKIIHTSLSRASLPRFMQAIPKMRALAHASALQVSEKCGCVVVCVCPYKSHVPYKENIYEVNCS